MGTKVTCLEDLQIFQKARELWRAVNALLDRPALRRDRQLHEQLADAMDSVVSNIGEGYEQPTDRAFARYLYDAKASLAEVRQRLWMAAERAYITKEQFDEQDAKGAELIRMIVGLIKYLLRSNRRDRGAGIGNSR